MQKVRCPWADKGIDIYEVYHDTEWGKPVHDDQKNFEFLMLENAQAGLSWLTILRKRENYRKAFANFDPKKVAKFNSADIERLMSNEGIVRNRQKIKLAINNAQQFLKIQQEFGSFDNYQWQFVGGKPLQNKWSNPREVPDITPEAIAFSKDLKKRGFTFVGPTTIYAHMQAVGMVNDHLVDCFRYDEVNKKL